MKRINTMYLIVLLIGSLPASAAYAENEGRRIENVRELTSEVAENFPGLSIAVAVAGEVVWSEGFGLADLDSGSPVTADTRFLAFSAAKPWTATAAARLLERGVIRIDQSIADFVPDFPDKRHPITAYQLATHSAGIRHYQDESEAIDAGRCSSVTEALAIFADDPLEFMPGERKSYSSWGYVLLSAVIEGASGSSFDEVMNQEIFDIAEMRSTVHAVRTGATRDWATPYRREGEAFAAVENLDASCKWGAGGYMSTPGDLVRFYVAMLDGRLLSPSTRQMVMSPDGSGIIRVGGSSVGGRSQVHVDPEREVIVAVTANEIGAGVDLRGFAERVARLFTVDHQDPGESGDGF